MKDCIANAASIPLLPLLTYNPSTLCFYLHNMILSAPMSWKPTCYVVSYFVEESESHDGLVPSSDVLSFTLVVVGGHEK